MVNLALTAEEKSEYGQPSVMSDGPEYPYGLRITLDDETLEKLGIPLPEAGSFVMITARCQVTSVIQTADTDGDGGSDSCVQLQITDMDVGLANSKSQAQRLYGE